MNDNILNYLLSLFGGMLLSLLSIYFNDKIRKRERPEKYQEKIYDEKLIVYKALSSKLSIFINDLLMYMSNKIDDKKLYNSRMELLSCFHENGIFLSGPLIEALEPIISLEQPLNHEISDDNFKIIVKSFVTAMATMKKELGFPTVHSKFEEIFPEIISLKKSDLKSNHEQTRER